MEFRTLGPFEALHGGVPVDLGDLQQRFALAVLLLNANKPVSPERLIETVWPTDKPKTNLITGYVARLRRTFKVVGATDVTIDTTPTGYVLRLDEDCVDSVRFTRLCRDADAAKRTGDRARAARLLAQALDLWRGRHFEDLDIDRIGGTEVILLDDARLDAAGDLAELQLDAGEHRPVLDRLRPVVRADPTRQRHAGLLMRALLANGDQVEAINVYYRTRDALDEAGLAPAADLRNLAWLALHGESRRPLPPRPARFTGRATELASIVSIAESGAGEPRTVWLSGTPGVGKTGLAIEAAHRLEKVYGGARLFLSLNGFTPGVEPTAPGDALAQLLGELGVPAEHVPPDLARRRLLYQDKLVDTRTLVVLDNAMSEDQVLPLLPEAPGCLAIVTSRTVGGLAASDSIRLAPLPRAEAAELFGRLIGAERSWGRSAQVDEVVDRCGRLPLQIRMVAAQFRRHDRWPLDHLVRLLAEHGQDFDACVVSYEQLGEAQRRLFRLFGQVPGRDLGVAGVAALAGCEVPVARRLLDTLHEASLLEEIAPERYLMLDPVKEFAAAVPEGTPHERSAALERLLDFYLVAVFSAATTAFPFDRGHPPAVQARSAVAPEFADKTSALGWLSAERSNLVAAIRYASRNLPDHAWRLAVLLWRYFSTIGEVGDWLETLELARKIVMADPSNRYGQAHVLLRLAMAHRRSQLTQAQELAAQALPRWVELGDLRGEADTLCVLGTSKMELGEYGQAIAEFESALAKYEQTGDQRGQANALSMLGNLNEQQGHLDEALRQHLAAVPMLRAIGHTQALAHAVDNLGSVQQRLGLFDDAMASHEEAHRLAMETGDRTAEAYALNNIGNVHRLRGRLDEAMRHHELARTVADAVSDAHLRTQLYLDRGATFHARGDRPDALKSYRAALDLAGGAGDRNHQALAHQGIAHVLHETGAHEAAAPHWMAAETEFAVLHQPEALDIQLQRKSFDCACA